MADELMDKLFKDDRGLTLVGYDDEDAWYVPTNMIKPGATKAELVKLAILLKNSSWEKQK